MSNHGGSPPLHLSYLRRVCGCKPSIFVLPANILYAIINKFATKTLYLC